MMPSIGKGAIDMKLSIVDHEEDNLLQAIIDENTGITLVGFDQNGDMMDFLFHKALFKRFCQQVIKHIDERATNSNYIGEVYEEV